MSSPLRPRRALSHRVREVIQKLRRWKWLLIRIAPESLIRLYHSWSVRLEFDPRRYPRETLPAGLNIIGYLRSASGIGESARSFVKAAEEGGVPAALYNASGGYRERSEDDSLGSITQENPFDINLFCVNSQEMTTLRESLGGRFFANRVNVGYWYWEFPELPASHRNRFEGLDEIWVASEFVRSAVKRALPLERAMGVHVLPPLVEPRRSPASRGQLGLEAEEFVFLALADAGSVLSRKNPEGAIEAFVRAFGVSKDVRLIVKVNHPGMDPAGVTALKRSAGRASIRVLDRVSSRDEIDALLFHCDALVSLHRSEGLGLPCAEAMALGKPVIATDYSGSTDFVSRETGFPVPCKLVQLPQAIGPYEAGAFWAEPDLDAAASAMKQVVEDRRESRRRGAAGASFIEGRYGRAAVAEMLRSRLDWLRSRRQ
ncbi:MAG: glycosyltransferase family 4 protein [Thermoanaerobaculia bacterium]